GRLPGHTGEVGATRRCKVVCRSSLFCTGMASPRGFEPPTSGLGNRYQSPNQSIKSVSKDTNGILCTAGAPARLRLAATPSGPDWLHEIKYDGYRMRARLADGKAQLVTRASLD